MNADRLLAYYERIADAPDAIPRFRRFILNLAVCGKLVEQDPNDEPVETLLERVIAKKGEQVKAGKVRSRAPLARVKEDKPPFHVPVTWCWVRFGNIADFSAGRTPSRNEPSYWDSGDHAWFSIADIVDGETLVSTKETVTKKAAIQVFGTEPEQVGTMIMSFKLTIGKIGRLGIPAYHNEAIIAIRPYVADLDPYLFKTLPMFARQGNTKGAIKGNTLNRKSISNILLPFPPLGEQHRIVAKVDELMTLCDRLETARTARETTRDRLAAASFARLNEPHPDPAVFQNHASFALDNLIPLTIRPDQIKALRQTILNLAVRGKLVEQDPYEEPASELLKGITEDKKQRAVSARDRRAGPVEPLDLISTEMPFDLPQSWVWVAFGDITISRDGERIPVSKAEREQRAKLYDYYGASGVIDKIDGYLFDKPLLLIGEDGANLINRTTAIAFIARGKYWVNNHAHVVDGLSEDYLRYLELFINATDLRPFVTGTAQPKMNQARMNSIPVALPPLAEQHRIVTQVNELMGFCDRMEASLARVDDTRRRLLDALLHEALARSEEKIGRDAFMITQELHAKPPGPPKVLCQSTSANGLFE